MLSNAITRLLFVTATVTILQCCKAVEGSKTTSPGPVVHDYLVTNDSMDHLLSPLAEAAHHFDTIMCNQDVCTCSGAVSNKTYFTGMEMHEPINIDCSCGNSNRRIYYLLSPHPVPHNTSHLVVRNCDTVIVQSTEEHASMAGSWPKPDHLLIKDVKELVIQKNCGFWAAYNVGLMRIQNISEVPLGVLRSASFRDYPLYSFVMEDVQVGVVRSQAFAQVYAVGYFEMMNVSIANVERDAFVVNLMAAESVFKMNRTRIGSVDEAGIVVTSPLVFVLKSSFRNISFKGLVADVEDFVFTENTVRNSAPMALSVQARRVFLVGNKFEYLQRHALHAVRKSDRYLKLGEQTHVNWTYVFVRNEIHYHTPGSLNPNWTLGPADEIEHNYFAECDCFQLLWLTKVTTRFGGESTPAADLFYTALLSTEGANACETRHCILPLDFYVSAMRAVPENNTCDQVPSSLKLCIRYTKMITALNGARSVYSFPFVAFLLLPLFVFESLIAH